VESLFPIMLVAASAFATKYIIDAIPKKPPGWLKNLLSLAISIGFVVAYKIDVLAAQMDVEPSLAGYVLTGLLLAGVTSKVVHPLVDAVRSNGK